MISHAKSTRLRDLGVFGAFWLAAVILLREVFATGLSLPALVVTILAAFVLALGAIIIAAVGLRARFVRVWAPAIRIAYGAFVLAALSAFFFGGAYWLGQDLP